MFSALHQWPTVAVAAAVVAATFVVWALLRSGRAANRAGPLPPAAWDTPRQSGLTVTQLFHYPVKCVEPLGWRIYFSFSSSFFFWRLLVVCPPLTAPCLERHLPPVFSGHSKNGSALAVDA